MSCASTTSASATVNSFRAFRIHQDGKQVAPRLETIALSDLGPGDVVVKVGYSTINYKDALAATGAGKILRKYPLVGGIDLAGEVVSSQHPEFKPGQKVLVNGCGLSETHDGGYAEYARVQGDWVVPIPAGLSEFQCMSIGTLVLVLYYSVKVKGLGGWLHELAVAPFGMAKITWNPLTWIAALLLGIANVGMNIVEYLGRTLSHGMRLYGNMYAGELIFFLIAGLGGTATAYGIAMHLVTGTVWALFHILIVLLQAFIFMMLTLVYIGQAHEHH